MNHETVILTLNSNNGYCNALATIANLLQNYKATLSIVAIDYGVSAGESVITIHSFSANDLLLYAYRLYEHFNSIIKIDYVGGHSYRIKNGVITYIKKVS